MTKKITFVLCLLSFWINGFACLNTYQFKIFPVGMFEDQLISVDVQIRRTSISEGDYQLNLKDINEWDEMYLLYLHVTAYDKNQKVKNTKRLEVAYTLGRDYNDTLLVAYQRGLRAILKNYPKIDLFTPVSLSYCDYQKKCELVQLSTDSLSDIDYMTFKAKRYPITITQDTSYFALKSRLNHPGNATELNISSVRIYETETATLVLAHLETGQTLVAADADDNPPNRSKEYIPELEFSDIEKAVYQEPLLHHGNGFDIFVLL